MKITVNALLAVSAALLVAGCGKRHENDQAVNTAVIRVRMGSELRASCGVGAVGGLVVASLLSLYFIPLFYLLFAGKPVAVDRKPEEGGVSR